MEVYLNFRETIKIKLWKRWTTFLQSYLVNGRVNFTVLSVVSSPEPSQQPLLKVQEIIVELIENYHDLSTTPHKFLTPWS